MKVTLEKLAIAIKDMFSIDIGGVSFDVNDDERKRDEKWEKPQIRDKDKKQLQ